MENYKCFCFMLIEVNLPILFNIIFKKLSIVKSLDVSFIKCAQFYFTFKFFNFCEKYMMIILFYTKFLEIK